MFVGREAELRTLERLYARPGFQFPAIYGRRRVGKTSLIREFAKDKRTLFFTAQEQSDSDNLADFSREVARFFGLPSDMRFGSWRAAIDYICEQAERERFVLVFDEFPYVAKRFAALPSLLQIAIDRRLQGTQLFLVLCGSNQGFMESDVLGYKSPLYGRRTLQVKLKPFGYREAAEMLPWMDADEAFRTYACIGGVPYYLSQVREGATLKENLAQLYFRPPGFLYSEPELLLLDEITSALDPLLVGEVLDMVEELKHQGATILMATHEVHFAHSAADRIVLLREGKIAENGTPTEVMDESQDPETRAFFRSYRG